jgi:hypothetical protein
MSNRRPTSRVSLLGGIIWLAVACLLGANSHSFGLTAVDDWGAAPVLVQTSIDVLKNDTEATGTITITGTTTPTAGSVVISGGKLLYSPGGAFTGTDSFEYTITDESGAIASATVHVIPAPVARPDSAFLLNVGFLRVPVLANDKQTEGAPLRVVKPTNPQTKPQNGTAQINDAGNAIIYIPGPNFAGHDSFEYTVRYDFGTESKSTVTIFAPAAVAQGSLGANITDTDGNIVGNVRITITASGAFSGKVEIETNVYTFLGSLDAKGRFTGVARSSDGDLLPLSLAVKNASGGAELRASFGASAEWTVTQKVSTLTSDGLEALEGRYTVELSAAAIPRTSDQVDDGTDSTTSTSGSLPQGIGWMTIKVNKFGNASLQGRTGDGRSFSANGQVVGSDSEPELPFHAEWDDSVLAGTLTLGETVDGDLRWILSPNDEDRYPGGFDVTISTTGGRYREPEDGRRALHTDSNDAGRVTISISGGGTTEFSREMRLSEDDDVSPIIEGIDEVEFDIDRDSGTFNGKFRDFDDREKRIKFSGVLLQADGRGVGLFELDDKTGRVEITVSAETSSLQ